MNYDDEFTTEVTDSIAIDYKQRIKHNAYYLRLYDVHTYDMVIDAISHSVYDAENEIKWRCFSEDEVLRIQKAITFHKLSQVPNALNSNLDKCMYSLLTGQV